MAFIRLKKVLKEFEHIRKHLNKEEIRELKEML